MDSDDLKLALGLLKKDVEVINTIYAKLDTNIEKMQEMSVSVARLLALHENKLDQQDKINKEINQLIELRRTEVMNDIKDLNQRLSSMQRELAEKIETIDRKITNEIQSLKEEVVENKKTASGDWFSSFHNWEKWKYMIIGGAVVMGFILAKASIPEFISILK
jgi:phage host-nuclease inhibitor protein Gam